MKNKHMVLFLCLLLGLVSAKIYGWDSSDIEKVVVKYKAAEVYLKMDPTSLVIRIVPQGFALNAERISSEWLKVTLPADDQGFTAIGYIRSSDVAPDPTVPHILSLKNGETIKGRIIAASVDEVKVDTGSFTATIKMADILEMKPAEDATPLKPEKREPEPAQARTHDKRAMISASRFSLAISPGFGVGLFKTNDLNKYRGYLAGVYDDEGDYFEWKKPRLSMNFGLEAIYQVSRSFGLGLGVGYLQYGSSGKYGWDDGDEFGHYEQNFTVRALTIQINLYQSFKLGRNVSFQLTGGGDAFVSFLNVKKTYDYDYWSSSGFLDWFFGWGYFYSHSKSKGDYSDRYSGFSLGFHAGIQFQIDLSPRVALVFGSLFQWARLSNFLWKEHISNGDASSGTEEGTLWFYDNPGGSKGFSVLAEPSTNENYHKANFDLSGISFRAGIKIGL